ncbi:MAG: hypothetical protein IJL47_02360 [Lachnospiraceae bacterium]|nr:hypothetical protein [Lachnospiraceae bacterium]
MKADRKLLIIVLLTATILAAVLPMGLAPMWNGEKPGHRDQYERMAEALLNGRLDLDYGAVDPRLLALENPYDPQARKDAGVVYHYDHAFYNGRYYMYFGIVPVILVFLPYRLITGTSLTTYHGTQLFAAVFIIGLFTLFFLLRKHFFPRLSVRITAVLSSALSLMSLWYAVSTPALYCTAITSGIAMEVWSLYFFIRAVYTDEPEDNEILLAFLGSLFGALAFGCRPPVALANLLVIPMLAAFLRRRKFSGKLLGELVLAALPYVLIGGLLMWYNYARFGNVLEFGQTYQLTIRDLSGGMKLTKARLLEGLTYYLSKSDGGNKLLRYGACFTFPILLLALLPLFRLPLYRLQPGRKLSVLFPLYLCLLALPLIIAALDTAGSPLLLARYRMDLYWIMGIAAFAGIGAFGETVRKRKAYDIFLALTALFTVLICVNLFFVPNDFNYASTLEKLPFRK